MKQRFRRYLAMFLSVAMVFTMLPASVAMADEAAGGEPAGVVTPASPTTPVTALEPVTAKFFGASGTQSEENSWLIATTGNGSATGTKTAAAYVKDETASSNAGGLGSARMAGMVFELPNELDESVSIAKATVTMKTTGANQNLGDNWTKLGLFQVAANAFDNMNVTAETMKSEENYPAIDNNYAKDATVYSEERISKTPGTATFDVTDWLKASVQKKEKCAIYRLQTVAAGVLVSKDMPVLKIITDAEAVAADAEAITLPSTVRDNLTLPKEGSNGTVIEWSSSNESVISNTGIVTRGAEDISVTLTATIKKGNEVKSKLFTITVKKLQEQQNDLLAEYTFSIEGTAVAAKDITEQFDAEVRGSGATVQNGMLALPGGGAGSDAAYVELPGELFEGQNTLTITTWLKNETGAGDYAAMFFGSPSKHVSNNSTADMPVNYWLLNPSKGGKFKSVWTNSNDANAPYNTETATSTVTTNDEWSLYTTVITPDKIIGYYNGEKASEASKTKTTIDFGDGLVAFIGRSSYNDKFYKGGVYGVKVFSRALTEDEIWDEYYTNYPSEATPFESIKSVLKEIMLGENESADSVVKPLSFPAEKNKVSLVWGSSDTTVIGADGKVGKEGQTVISVTGTYEGKEVFTESYNVTVISEETFVLNAIDIPNKDNIKGNITLPSVGKNGEPITWSSSNTDVISVEETVNSDYDNTPAGVVTRQAQNMKVTLTAKVDVNGKQAEKEIEVSVVKAAQLGTMTDYVFAYFIGDGAGQERIHFASSRDGLNWEELNGGEAVLESTLGTKGLRDPYICRSPEGDKFYMIATDLNIGSGTGWTAAQNAGSQAIMVWESDDLVNWGEQRMATVSAEIQAGCTWAPEFYYDDTTGEYIVFWASKVAPNYNKQRVYYCKTRDFYTFTEPKLWIEEDYSVIDTTVVKEDGVYYRFTKNENDGQKYIYIETSDTLLGEWTRLSSPTLEAYNNTNGKAVEGPCCFRFNDDDIEGTGGYKWGLLLDNWTYFAVATKDLSTAVFDSLDTAKLPSRPRHGTIMNITADEYQKIMEAYGRPSVADDAIPDYVATGYQLPEKVVVTYVGKELEVGVTWDKTAADFAQSGTVTVKGTLTGTDNDKIDGYEFTKTIEVISDKLIYYIDSGVGSWNQNMPKSSPYNAVSSIDGIALRNEIPDQTYSAENKWGIIGGDDIIGNRTSTTASIYSNGWYAKGGKNCEYVIPLENGTYSITGYFGEWWSVTRPMKFYAQYTNSEGEVVNSEEKTLTVSGSNSSDTCTLQLEVKDVAEGETVDVHILSTKNESSNPDPVIAGLSIEKLSMTEEEQELNAVISAFAHVDVAQESYELTVDNSADIEVKYPEGFADKLAAAGCEVSVAYKSDNNAVTVDENGKVQAVAEGTAKITVTFTLTRNSQTVKTVSKTVTVNVAKNEQQIAEEAVKAALEKITLAKSSYELTAGDTATITVNYPEGFKDKLTAAGLTATTRYSADNAAVSVNDNGKITAAAAGTATITVTVTLNDAGTTSKSLTAAVKVNAKQQSGGDNQGGNNQGGTNQGDGTTQSDTTPAKIKLSVTKAFSLGLGESTKLTATVTNKAGEVLKNQKITWSVDKKGKKAVTVKNGKITASKKKTGTATITAKTSNGKTAKVKVTVKKKPTKITITYPKKKSVTLKKGKTLKLKTKVTPSKAASYKITYKSSKKKVASVSDKGVVKALKKGTATITVKTYNGKSAKVKVTVK